MCKGMNSTDLFDPDWTKPHSYQVDFYQFSLPPSPKFPFCLSVFHTCPLCSQCNKDSSEYCLDKAPRLSISIVIWILSSDTICQLNQFHTNGEAATLSNTAGRLNAAHDMDEFQICDQSKVFLVGQYCQSKLWRDTSHKRGIVCYELLLGAGWQKLHGSTGGTRRKVWTRTKILSPNIRYFAAN